MYNQQQQRGLSAGMFGPMPQYQGNMAPPANYWQGNQMMIPGADGLGGLAQAIGQRGQQMAAEDQEQANAKKPSTMKSLLQSGILGILPGLLAGLIK